MWIRLENNDNIDEFDNIRDGCIDLVYADMIYNDANFPEWISKSLCTLKEHGIIMIQTDYHTVAEVKLYLDAWKLHFVNWVIYKQEWGGISRRSFPKKHDDILIYAKSKNYKFYPERVMIPKKTAGTALDKKGTGLKIPCDVFDDLGNFSTLDKERVKRYNRNIQWQKPLKLMNRLLLPFTDEEDYILDPFMGSGSTGVWCVQNNRNFVGIEKDKEIFDIAKERIDGELLARESNSRRLQIEGVG